MFRWAGDRDLLEFLQPASTNSLEIILDLQFENFPSKEPGGNQKVGKNSQQINFFCYVFGGLRVGVILWKPDKIMFSI